MPARVYIDLTYEQEAELYAAFGMQNKQSALDRFRARVEAKEQTAIEIVETLAECELEIAFAGPGVGRVQAVYALDSIYRDHGREVLRATLTLLRNAWQHDPRAYTTYPLQGTAAFWIRYGAVLKVERLVEKMRAVGIEGVSQKAIVYRSVKSFNHSAYGRALVDVYNVGLRSGALPEWVEHVLSERGRESHRAKGARMSAAYRGEVGPVS